MESGIDREHLLNTLLLCDESGMRDRAGIGGPTYWYAHVAEDGGFIRHPGLPGGQIGVRVEDDMRWLLDQRFIQVRQWSDDRRSFTFEVTDVGRSQLSGER